MSYEVQAAAVAELLSRFRGIANGKAVSALPGRSAVYHSTVGTVSEGWISPQEISIFPAVLVLDHLATELDLTGEHEYLARWLLPVVLYVHSDGQDESSTRVPDLLRRLEDDVILAVHTDPTLGLPGLQVTVLRFDKEPPTSPDYGGSVCTLQIRYPFEAVR